MVAGRRPKGEFSMTTLPDLTLYQWYTIRHGLHLIMQNLLYEENPDCAEELESQRSEECTYIRNLQATISQIIDIEEKRLGITPIKGNSK